MSLQGLRDLQRLRLLQRLSQVAAPRERKLHVRQWDTETKQYKEVFSQILNQQEWEGMQTWYNFRVYSKMPQGPSNSDKRKSTEEVAARIIVIEEFDPTKMQCNVLFSKTLTEEEWEKLKELHHRVSSKSNVVSVGHTSVGGGISIVNSVGDVSIGNTTVQVDQSKILDALREIFAPALGSSSGN